MDISLKINGIDTPFTIEKITFAKPETGQLLLTLKNQQTSNLSCKDCDCCLIFSHLKERVSISFFGCTVLCHVNHLIIAFDDAYTVPTIHAKLFKWIELKLQTKPQNRFWHSLNKSDKFHWLRLNFEFQKHNPVIFHRQASINGLFIRDKLDFLCEAGEQLVNYGYVGSDLDGFHDALSNGINGLIPIQPFNLKWINFSYSQRFVQADVLRSICDVLYSLPNCRFQKMG